MGSSQNGQTIEDVVQPNPRYYRWLDFTQPEKLIVEGRRAAHLALADALSIHAA